VWSTKTAHQVSRLSGVRSTVGIPSRHSIALGHGTSLIGSNCREAKATVIKIALFGAPFLSFSSVARRLGLVAAVWLGLRISDQNVSKMI
jgi:hypothetical protein